MVKKTILIASLLFSGAMAITACSDNEVADVSLGIFTLKDIKLNSFVDPLVPGVTCHVASIEANLSLSDPSDSAVSCRQTGEITPEMIARIKKGKTGEVVFEKSKSWDEGTKNGPDRSALLGHNFVYQETKPHGFYSSYFHQRISS